MWSYPGHTPDVVIHSKFHSNPFRGLGAPRGRNLPIPITLAVGFYNSLHYCASRDTYVTNRKACVSVIELTVKLLRRNIDKTDLVWTGSNLNWSKLPGCGCAAPHLPYQIPSVLPYLPLHKQARHYRFNCYFQLRRLRRIRRSVDVIQCPT